MLTHNVDCEQKNAETGEQFKTFEFFIDDLKDEVKSKFIEFLDGDNGNHDVIPFCTYETVVNYEPDAGIKTSPETRLLRLFKVTITETLKLTVEVEAWDQHEAEQIVSDNWKKSEYILDADNFVGVEFEAIPIDEVEDGDNGS